MVYMHNLQEFLLGTVSHEDLSDMESPSQYDLVSQVDSWSLSLLTIKAVDDNSKIAMHCTC
jgi:hypothetical protein